MTARLSFTSMKTGVHRAPLRSVRGALVDLIRIVPACNRAVLQADVVLFAGVLHDHVGRGFQRPHADVHPVMRERFRVVDRERVLNCPRVCSQEGVRENRIFAVGMSVRIEPGITVEARRHDNQRIAIPMPGGDTVPAGRKIFRPFEVWIQRHPMEPGVLLPEEGQRIIAVDDLHAVGRIETA